MIYPPLGKLMSNMDSRYTLVTVTAKRSRQLSDGSAQPLVDVQSDKSIIIAINEIVQHKIGYIKPEVK